tara:strand:- start:117 stop:275 length:159 start_codon:yes stop_codon:yes gene_type:complete
MFVYPRGMNMEYQRKRKKIKIGGEIGVIQKLEIVRRNFPRKNEEYKIYNSFV